jgi:hypothetical protein
MVHKVNGHCGIGKLVQRTERTETTEWTEELAAPGIAFRPINTQHPPGPVLSVLSVFSVLSVLQLPVLPNPPAPRSVPGSSSTVLNVTGSTRATTICAIRIPRDTSTGSAPRFTSMIISSPR